MEFLEKYDPQAYVDWWNRVYPKTPTSLESFLHQDSTRGQDAKILRVWAVEHEKTIAAISLVTPITNPQPGELLLRLLVPEEHQNHISEIFAHALQCATQLEARLLRTNVREDEWLYGFWQAQGFVETDRVWYSVLSLDMFDQTPFLPKLQKAKKAGLQIRSLKSQLERAGFDFLYYQAIIELLQDVPSASPLQPWDFETWKARSLGTPDSIPEAEFIGFIGDEIVGVSQLLRYKRPNTIGTGLTGVKRSFRGLGVAYALKLAAIDYAQEHGYGYIITMNHVINRPMLSINEALGFAKEPASIQLQKEV